MQLAPLASSLRADTSYSRREVRGRGPLQWSVDVAFVAALGLAWYAGRAPEVVRTNAYGFELREVAHRSGIDFVHRSPELDPKIAHIETQVAGVGAAVSVVDVDQDGWP